MNGMMSRSGRVENGALRQFLTRAFVMVSLIAVISACSSAHTRDIDTETRWFETSVELPEEQLHIIPPDDVTIWLGLDGHPNLARVCLDGIAFVTSTSEFKAFERTPEWDSYCEAAYMRMNHEPESG